MSSVFGTFGEALGDDGGRRAVELHIGHGHFPGVNAPEMFVVLGAILHSRPCSLDSTSWPGDGMGLGPDNGLVRLERPGRSGS